MTIHLYQYDLPELVAKKLSKADTLAVDTETLGLNLERDRLCLVQLSAGDGDAHLVHFPEPRYDEAPNLVKLLSNDTQLKLFHYARFDMAILTAAFDVMCDPVYCTKIASKIARTYTDRHGLKNLCQELLGVELDKQQQSSYWAAETLTKEQQQYAANDVLYLHQLREKLDDQLDREMRQELVMASHAFLPVRAALDLEGWGEVDIFSH